MGLFSLFKKKKDKTIINDTKKSVDTKISEKEKATADKSKKVESPLEAPAKKAVNADVITPDKKAEAPATTVAKEKKEEAPIEAPIEAPVDDASADAIAVDENAEVIKTKGLSGFFEIKKSKDGRFVFNLYASNKVIIATSQVYSSSASALNGANSVIANAERAAVEDNTLKNATPVAFPKWEIYRDKAEKFRFRLFAPNGSCICHSQGYTSKASCKNGIESIIRTVKNASIDKSYLKKDKKKKK